MLYINRTLRNMTVEFVAMDDRLRVEAYVSSLMILDNVGVGPLNQTATGAAPGVFVPSLSASSQMCWTVVGPSDMGHWKRMDYDPTFSAIFSPDVTPSSNRSKPLGLAIGLSLGLVALIVIVVVLLFVFSPAVKNWITPYYKRAEAHENRPLPLEPDTPSSPPSPRTWARGSTPN